jgi:YD repeat-containing protein
VLTTLPDSATRTTAYSAVTTGSAYDSVTVTDELARVTRTVRDAFGRTIETVEQATTTDLSTTVAWSLLDRITGISDPAGNAWSNTWDSLGRRTVAVDPDLGTWTFAYDAVDRLTSQVDALGQETRFTYDGLDRVLTKTARYGTPQAETTTNIYDEVRSGFYNIGKLTTSANPNGTITYDYDEGGRTKQQAWTVTGLSGTRTATTGYAASGEVLWKAWPDGDSTGSAGSPWTYDGAGRLYAIPGEIVSTAYNAAGQVTSIAYGNGVTTQNTYNNARAWIMGIETKDALNTNLQTIAYTRDAAGRILTYVATPTAENWTYTGACPPT